MYYKGEKQPNSFKMSHCPPRMHRSVGDGERSWGWFEKRSHAEDVQYAAKDFNVIATYLCWHRLPENNKMGNCAEKAKGLPI